MTTEIKTVYQMVASSVEGLSQHLHDLCLGGFQSLSKNDKSVKIHFGRIGKIKDRSKITFPEFFHHITSHSQDLPAFFQLWILSHGVSFGDSLNQWDTYFFQKELTHPRLAPNGYHYLAYFDYSVDESEVLKYESLLTKYVLAGKQADALTLGKLLQGMVYCDACGKLVDPVLRAQEGGSLRCPFCNQPWTEIAGPTQVVNS